jgi:TRAP-type uncharacterized transport system substrate-binding protein
VLRDPIDLRILCAGRNWMNVGSLLALGLNGYYSPLPKGSTIAAISGDPGTMCMEGPRLVAEGRYHLAITTPAWYVAMARAGNGPFETPLPLRAIAVLPHDDRLALAVRRETGITSLAEIVERELPLKISTPARELNHPAGWVVDAVMEQYGFSREHVERWGGELLRDRPRFQNSPDSVPIDPRFDAIFDEAIMTLRWRRISESYDLRFLPIDEQVREHFAGMGMPRGTLERGRMRGLDADVATIDFSGWALCCREDMPDELGYLVARALDEQHEEISARFADATAGMTSPIDMHRVGRDAPVPLNAGAEQYYRDHGYL